MKWLEIPIKKLCLPTYQRDPREKPNEIFSYVDISSIDRERKVISQTSQILGAEAPSRARKEIKAGDILVSTVRPNLNAVAMVPPELDGQIASTGFCVLRPKSDSVLGGYLFYYTRTPDFFETLSSKVKGAHYPAVSDRDVKGLELPLPPPSEQRRIVEILDQADALRKKRTEADARAARILPALFYKMFGDPLSLMLDRDSIPLGQFDIDLQNGFACGQKDVEEGVPHLRMNNIDDAGVLNIDLIRTVPAEKDDQRYRLQAGDVLFMGTNSEDKIGKTCVFFPPDGRHYLFSNHLIRIRISDSRLSPEFLATYLHLLWVKRFYPSIAKRWVNQATIAQAALKNMKVPVPQRQSLTQFNHAFGELLLSRSKRIQSTKRINVLFGVLLHRAFTGNLTAQWREAHMKELLEEMEHQAKQISLQEASQ